MDRHSFRRALVERVHTGWELLTAFLNESPLPGPGPLTAWMVDTYAYLKNASEMSTDPSEAVGALTDDLVVAELFWTAPILPVRPAATSLQLDDIEVWQLAYSRLMVLRGYMERA